MVIFAGEVKKIILGFICCEDGLATNEAITDDTLRTIKMPVGLGVGLPGGVYRVVQLHIIPKIGMLFTSKDFLELALPISARNSYIEITRVTSRPLSIRCIQKTIVQTVMSDILMETRNVWLMELGSVISNICLTA